MVFSSTLWVIFSLLVAHRSFLVSSCDHCGSFGRPSFSPSTLVVQYGASASVTCTVCNGTCDKGLEKSLGTSTENDTAIRWVVEKMTEWNPSPLCFHTDDHGNHCCSRLRVTVYQLLDNVSITFVNHSGELLEGQQYTLQCSVPNVAPVNSLTVTFYRGQEELRKIQPDGNQKTPVSKTFTLEINTTKEDDGAHYWCEAKLQLGPEGPQRPPVASSNTIRAVVHYKPQLQQPSHLQEITVKEGNPLLLNCSAEGNPSPAYSWKHPPGESYPLSYNDSIVTIASAALTHAGQHVCSVHNKLGSISVTFNINVERDLTFLYILLAVMLLAVVFILVIISYIRHQKSKTGHYNLMRMLRFSNAHVAVPVEND